MPKKILVVDDEPLIVKLVQVNLQKVGYQVITASNGREALEQVAVDRPDLILLDVMMPVMDGFETLQRLKGDEATANIPVIMLTANAQDVIMLEAYKNHVDLFLTKPFDPRSLIIWVKHIFDVQRQNEEIIHVLPTQNSASSAQHSALAESAGD
jgi:two-component system alkaline phosphatase synthesis response regulator PhoP/two-component system response regulator VicR